MTSTLTPDQRQWLEELAEDDGIARWGPDTDKVSIRAALLTIDAQVAESEGRRKALVAKAEEYIFEWTRAEAAESRVQELTAERDALSQRLASAVALQNALKVRQEDYLAAIARADDAEAERDALQAEPRHMDYLRLVDAEKERDALKRFKVYVHERLDAAGVPVDPPSEHREHGCRIGGRLDVLLSERDALRAELNDWESLDTVVVMQRLEARVRQLEWAVSNVRALADSMRENITGRFIALELEARLAALAPEKPEGTS